MKGLLRTILTDLKAAVRIGHPDAIAAALEGLAAQSEIASNQTLADDFISQVILPFGEVLSHSRTPDQVLESFAEDPTTGIKAIAIVAQVLRLLREDEPDIGELTRLANDSRADIRVTLVRALASAGSDSNSITNSLAKEWLQSEDKRVQQTGLQVVAKQSTPQIDILEFIADIGTYPDRELNQDVVSALINLAQKDAAQEVLSQFKEWLDAEPPNSWVITRALSSSWASHYSIEALEILKSLAIMKAAHKQIISALRALIRHGAEDAVQAELAQWQLGKDDNLSDIVEKITE